MNAVDLAAAADPGKKEPRESNEYWMNVEECLLRKKNISIVCQLAEEERQRRLDEFSDSQYLGEYQLTISRAVIPITLAMDNLGRCSISEHQDGQKRGRSGGKVAHLHLGDELVAINCQTIENFSYHMITERLKRTTQRPLVLTFIRKPVESYELSPSATKKMIKSDRTSKRLRRKTVTRLRVLEGRFQRHWKRAFKQWLEFVQFMREEEQARKDFMREKERARKEAEEQARKGAEEQTRKEAEEQARKEAEEQARKEANEQAQKEAKEKKEWKEDDKARKGAEEQARKEAEEQARKEAEEQARKEAEEQAARFDALQDSLRELQDSTSEQHQATARRLLRRWLIGSMQLKLYDSVSGLLVQ
jgi:pyruvate/2-oxoglutarate dehydrogenase complex dihydrolipoamide acyltransferase (E2) component